MLFRQPLGEMLLTEGLITQAQLDAALKAQAERGLPIGQLLVEDGAVTEAVLMAALARQLGLEFVDLAEYPIDRGAGYPRRNGRSTLISAPQVEL